jgi:hypothetical protein
MARVCGGEEKRREEKSERRWREKPRRLTAYNHDGFRHRKSPGNKSNPDEPIKDSPRHRESSGTHRTPTQKILRPSKTLSKPRRPILTESKKLPIKMIICIVYLSFRVFVIYWLTPRQPRPGPQLPTVVPTAAKSSLTSYRSARAYIPHHAPTSHQTLAVPKAAPLALP